MTNWMWWFMIGALVLLKIAGALSIVLYVRLWGLRLWCEFGKKVVYRRTAVLLFNLFGFQLWIQRNRSLRLWLAKNCEYEMVPLELRGSHLRGAVGFTDEWVDAFTRMQAWNCFAWLSGDRVEYLPGAGRSNISLPRNRAFFYPIAKNYAVHFRPKTIIAHLIYFLTQDLDQAHVFFVPRDRVYGV